MYHGVVKYLGLHRVAGESSGTDVGQIRITASPDPAPCELESWPSGMLSRKRSPGRPSYPDSEIYGQLMAHRTASKRASSRS